MNREELIQAAFQKIISGDEDQLFLAARDLKIAKKNSGYTQDTEIDYYLCLLEYLTETNHSYSDIYNFFLGKLEGDYHHNLKKLIENKDVRIEGSYRLTKIDLNSGAKNILSTLPQLWLKSLKYDAIVAQVQDIEAVTALENEKLDRIKSIIGELAETRE